MTSNSNGKHKPQALTGTPGLTDAAAITAALRDLLNDSKPSGRGHFTVHDNAPATLNYIDIDDSHTLSIEVTLAYWMATGNTPIVIARRATLFEPDIDGTLRSVISQSEHTIYAGPSLYDAAAEIWEQLNQHIAAWAWSIRVRDDMRRQTTIAIELRAKVLDEVPKAQIGSWRRDVLNGITDASNITWSLEALKETLHLSVHAPHGADTMDLLVGIVKHLVAGDSGEACHLCEKPARHDIIMADGGLEHLCDPCHDAFKLGQHNYGLRTTDLGGLALCGRCKAIIFLDEDESHYDEDSDRFYCHICTAHMNDQAHRHMLNGRRRSIVDLPHQGYNEDEPGGMSLEQLYEDRTELEPA